MSEPRRNAPILVLPRTGFAPGDDDVAAYLRELASCIEQGQYDEVITVVCIMELGDGTIERRTTGRPLDRARVIGLLSMAAQQACVEV